MYVYENKYIFHIWMETEGLSYGEDNKLNQENSYRLFEEKESNLAYF